MQGSAVGALLLREVDHLAREKFLDHEAVFESLELAFQKVLLDTYGADHDIRVVIDRKDGSSRAYLYKTVVDTVEDYKREVSKDDPKAKGVPVGEEIKEELPIPEFNRGAIAVLKQSLTKSIQDIERAAQYEEFKDRVGHILSGTVKRIEAGNVVLDLGRTEGVILKDELIQRESFRVNDRVKAYIYSVRQETHGFQIFLSRTHPGFLAKLFAQEVPEIYDGLIEIKSVARDPGSRAKVAIFSRDKERSFDPVGACVGVRGNRVNAVSQELQGEKIDIIQWSPELATFVVNAMTPAEVVRVILEGDSRGTVTVVVPDSQQSIAIGRRGQNVRLAHQLTGAPIEIVTESTETTRRTQERQERTTLFVEELGLDEMMAHFLVSEGFESIKDIAETSVEDLSALEGFTLDISEELQKRAIEALEEESTRYRQAFLEAGGDPLLVDLPIPPQFLDIFLKNNIVHLKEFADLSIEEILELLKEKDCDSEEWGKLIMAARGRVYGDE